jgi:ParB family transcriptional regulator, chromosome partitioning protein
LMSSIKAHGIIQPLVVTRDGDSYELIAGERRWRSAKLLGLKEIPVIIRSAGSQEKLELALIENLQRENLNPIEAAVAYNQLLNEFNLTQESVAQRVGRARSSVANSLRLLSLPAEIQKAIAEKKISEAHAKYLLSLESETKQLVVFKKILHQNLSVADTDTIIRRLQSKKSDSRHQDEALVSRLQTFFGTKASIKRGAKGGQIVINFSDDSELREIMKHIT